MAYVSKELVQRVRNELKPILKKYGFKATVSGTGKSSLSLNISAGILDVFTNYNQVLAQRFNREYACTRHGSMSVNTYHYKEHFNGKVLEFLTEALDVMNKGNHDRSDIMTDYFDVGWYVDVEFGKWDKPYVFVAE